jgi:hypothetical protein
MRAHERAIRRLLAALAALALTGGATATADTLRAHEVAYHVAFKGIGAGDIVNTLRSDGAPDRWLYETRAEPSFLARLVVNRAAREHCWLRVTDTGVQPERYVLDDGTSEHHDDSALTFDWKTGQLHGTARGEPLTLPLEPGLQDVLSIRLAPVAELAAGREPREFALLDGREIKRYVFTRVGNERLHTEIGDFDTVVYSSDRKGATGGRSWEYWYAPALGWLPVRAEQREDGHTRMSLSVRSLRWLGPAN